jgi:hypothetical protein
VPSKVVPERKSTLVTVAPELAAAVAVRETEVPEVRIAPAVGFVSETVGGTVVVVAVIKAAVDNTELFLSSIVCARTE